MKEDLLALSLPALEEACLKRGLPAYRARQVYHWVAQRYETDYEAMTDLSKALRRSFGEVFPIVLPRLAEKLEASDGTAKFRYELSDGACAEAVRMPKGDRTTLCLSSQTGCPLACTFCLTGRTQGRNMTTAEIIGQFLIVVQGLSSQRVNIVFMGMGEPLLNLGAVHSTLDFLNHSISPRRITVSTAGILRGIRELGTHPRHPRLALSLNASRDGLRRSLMPVSAGYTLSKLFQTLDDYPRRRGERVTLEYTLLNGVNTGEEDARGVVKLLEGRERLYKINLIPYNPVEGIPFREPDESTLQAFLQILINAHLTVTVRRSHGREIGAACGQLAAQSESEKS